MSCGCNNESSNCEHSCHKSSCQKQLSDANKAILDAACILFNYIDKYDLDDDEKDDCDDSHCLDDDDCDCSRCLDDDDCDCRHSNDDCGCNHRRHRCSDDDDCNCSCRRHRCSDNDDCGCGCRRDCRRCSSDDDCGRRHRRHRRHRCSNNDDCNCGCNNFFDSREKLEIIARKNRHSCSCWGR